MNDNLITKAIECYIEKLEKENKALQDFAREICDVFEYHGIEETDKDRIFKILSIVRFYEDIFKDGDTNDE